MATNKKKFELKTDARLENLPVIADFMAASMEGLSVEQAVLEVQMAVDEACTNIIKHAYSGKGGIIAITCELQGDDFIITISDRGKFFDVDSVSPPDLESDLEKRRVGGLGIHLMRKLMDEVNYSLHAKEGNSLVMKKRLMREDKK
jgi:serine/threonine-protein kinase RsbW